MLVALLLYFVGVVTSNVGAALMANNRPPKNDFAPAWLRLPETNPSPVSFAIVGPKRITQSML